MNLEQMAAVDAAVEAAKEAAESAQAQAALRESYRQHCRSALLVELVAAGEAARSQMSGDRRRSYRPYEPAEKTSLAGMAAALQRLGVDAASLAARCMSFEDFSELQALRFKYSDRAHLFARAFRGQPEFQHTASVLRALREHDRLARRAELEAIDSPTAEEAAELAAIVAAMGE